MIKVKVKAIMDIVELVGKRVQIITLEDNSTISDLLDKLIKIYGDPLANRLLDNNKELRSEILLLINGRNMTLLNGLETKMYSGDELLIFPPVGGG